MKFKLVERLFDYNLVATNDDYDDANWETELDVDEEDVVRFIEGMFNGNFSDLFDLFISIPSVYKEIRDDFSNNIDQIREICGVEDIDDLLESGEKVKESFIKGWMYRDDPGWYNDELFKAEPELESLVKDYFEEDAQEQANKEFSDSKDYDNSDPYEGQH